MTQDELDYLFYDDDILEDSSWCKASCEDCLLCYKVNTHRLERLSSLVGEEVENDRDYSCEQFEER